jgi:hypothetical protein
MDTGKHHIVVTGSHGDIKIDEEGNPIGELPYEYKDIIKFDMEEFVKWRKSVPQVIDILTIGYTYATLVGYAYEEPVEEMRRTLETTEYQEFEITLEEAFHVLKNCSMLTVDGSIPFRPSLSALQHSDENEFACFVWEYKGDTFYAKFAEGENKTVKCRKYTMTLIDVEGDEVEIEISFPMYIATFLANNKP